MKLAPPPPCGEVDELGCNPSSSGGGTVDRRAKSLRKNTTIAERILWVALRQLKPAGLHFRRQAPFGGYILDFVCHSAKLVVEADDSQHGTPEGIRYDAARTAFLNSQGYRVLRFWNVDAITNSRGICDAIYAVARSPPEIAKFILRPRFAWTGGRFRPPHKGEIENEAST